MALIEVKLRPLGPWRPGHAAGDRGRVDSVYHSDALFSALTHAMISLGWLEEWLDATARAEGEPAVRLGSLFPFSGRTRLVAPPRSVWPPSAATRLYLHGISLVPLDVLKSGLGDESRWNVDGESGCLLPNGAAAPFRVSMRTAAAVDRLGTGVEPHRTACLEFAPNAGFWGVFQTSDPVWESRVKAAFRLLADSGFGGERSRGWGRSAEPSFSDAAQLFGRNKQDGLWWLLSLYSPDASDEVDWSKGEYAAAVRGGWTDSPAGAAPKKQVRLIAEGSVISAPALRGRAVDVAPENFPHPVWRNGFALAVPLPVVAEKPAGKPAEAAPAAEQEPALSESAAEQTEAPEAPVREEPAVTPVEEAPAPEPEVRADESPDHSAADAPGPGVTGPDAPDPAVPSEATE